MSLFLTKADIAYLTGYQRPSCQIRWLREQGIRHFVAPTVTQGSRVARSKSPPAPVSLTVQSRTFPVCEKWGNLPWQWEKENAPQRPAATCLPEARRLFLSIGATNGTSSARACTRPCRPTPT
ncbi:DUF4224 domain-containing protein [Thiohalophilus sp.]|uniref:DUF4224 domain-containing protein n=1 Tax=Thiohalophilus sp. TaxID=3028392 RepID=UPI003A0FC063